MLITSRTFNFRPANTISWIFSMVSGVATSTGHSGSFDLSCYESQYYTFIVEINSVFQISIFVVSYDFCQNSRLSLLSMAVKHNKAGNSKCDGLINSPSCISFAVTKGSQNPRIMKKKG